MNPVKSAYGNRMIDDQHGAVTILAYRTGAHFGGHTHLAFEYPDAKGMSGVSYRHVVFHLVALGGQCGQMVTGCNAGVLKQVPVKGGKYGFVGGEAAFTKAQMQAKKKKQTLADEEKPKFKLLPVDNRERDLPPNDKWTTKKYRSQTVQVPAWVAKKGHMVCRKLAIGKTIDGIESKRFHKLWVKGTNCVLFAMQVLRHIGIKPNFWMEFLAWSSPPEAIKRGMLTYVF